VRIDDAGLGILDARLVEVHGAGDAEAVVGVELLAVGEHEVEALGDGAEAIHEVVELREALRRGDAGRDQARPLVGGEQVARRQADAVADVDAVGIRGERQVLERLRYEADADVE
jgi:hypothetical protein